MFASCYTEHPNSQVQLGNGSCYYSPTVRRVVRILILEFLSYQPSSEPSSLLNHLNPIKTLSTKNCIVQILGIVLLVLKNDLSCPLRTLKTNGRMKCDIYENVL